MKKAIRISITIAVLLAAFSISKAQEAERCTAAALVDLREINGKGISYKFHFSPFGFEAIERIDADSPIIERDSLKPPLYTATNNTEPTGLQRIDHYQLADSLANPVQTGYTSYTHEWDGDPSYPTPLKLLSATHFKGIYPEGQRIWEQKLSYNDEGLLSQKDLYKEQEQAWRLVEQERYQYNAAKQLKEQTTLRLGEGTSELSPKEKLCYQYSEAGLLTKIERYEADAQGEWSLQGYESLSYEGQDLLQRSKYDKEGRELSRIVYQIDTEYYGLSGHFYPVTPLSQLLNLQGLHHLRSGEEQWLWDEARAELKLHRSYQYLYDGHTGNCTPDAIADVIATESELKLFPNPARDYIELAATNIQEICIFDLKGRRMLSQAVGSTRIELGKLAPGTYILRARAQNGAYSSGRFVKL